MPFGLTMTVCPMVDKVLTMLSRWRACSPDVPSTRPSLSRSTWLIISRESIVWYQNNLFNLLLSAHLSTLVLCPT
jgi:hypothetical protein